MVFRMQSLPQCPIYCASWLLRSGITSVKGDFHGGGKPSHQSKGHERSEEITKKMWCFFVVQWIWWEGNIFCFGRIFSIWSQWSVLAFVFKGKIVASVFVFYVFRLLLGSFPWGLFQRVEADFSISFSFFLSFLLGRHMLYLPLHPISNHIPDLFSNPLVIVCAFSKSGDIKQLPHACLDITLPNCLT